jgi:glutamate formiminotransferase
LHPRIGAADVVPFVPVEGVTLDECVELAHQAGEAIWNTHRVPVYYYEAAALRPERKRLENVRRGQFERLRHLSATDPGRRPDVGGPALHPTAGAVAVGARKFLVAWNVILAGAGVEVAKDIARKIRASSGGFPHVKALGLWLPSRNRAQVSMNITDHEVTPVHVVFEAIRREAAAHGAAVESTEIIGLVPRAALESAAAASLQIAGFSPACVLETRIAEAIPPPTPAKHHDR